MRCEAEAGEEGWAAANCGKEEGRQAGSERRDNWQVCENDCD